MTLATPSRRRFLLGAAAVLAAPAVVRVAQLMPISAPKLRTGPFTEAEMQAIVRDCMLRWIDECQRAYAPPRQFLVSADALQAYTELSPRGLGFVDGVPPKIDRTPQRFWKNTATETV